MRRGNKQIKKELLQSLKGYDSNGYSLFLYYRKLRHNVVSHQELAAGPILFYHIGNCVIRRMNSQVRIANLQRMRSILFYAQGRTKEILFLNFAVNNNCAY